MAIDDPCPIHVIRLIAPLNIGGAAVYVMLQTGYLHPSEYECALVIGTVSSDEGDMQHYAEERGIHPATTSRSLAA